MKKTKKYVSPFMTIELFESDIITESPSSYDGTGYIPESWWNA